MDPALLATALLASVMLNAYLVATLARRTPHRYSSSACRSCGYDIRASVGGVCPECGAPASIRPAHLARAITRCNFCGKSNRQTGPHVEGPGDVFICAPCVETCHSVILKNVARQDANLEGDGDFADRRSE